MDNHNFSPAYQPYPPQPSAPQNLAPHNSTQSPSTPRQQLQPPQPPPQSQQQHQKSQHQQHPQHQEHQQQEHQQHQEHQQYQHQQHSQHSQHQEHQHHSQHPLLPPPLPPPLSSQPSQQHQPPPPPPPPQPSLPLPSQQSQSQPSQQAPQPSQHQHPQQQPGLAAFGNLATHSQQPGQSPSHQHQQHHNHPPQQPQTPSTQAHSPSQTTLPPLQGQNGYHRFGSMSYSAHSASQSQTPNTPHTPAQGSMTGPAVAPSSYVQHVSPSSATGPSSMLPPNFSSNPYSTISQPLMYPSSTTSTTSLPPTTPSLGLPTIRPMPPGGVNCAANGLPSLANTGQLGLGQQSSFMQSEGQPTHVVGSQGRRGILPSAPGRPNPPAQGSGQTTKSMIPQKDADGKYPCPHCNKTYLHAKHLKRHLLRHTGDRPYMCHLCKDTFSRSDILKRHFQKCSIRRGNPTGANHLAHQRRNTGSSNRLSISQSDGPIGLAGIQDVAGQPGYIPGAVGNDHTVNSTMPGRTSRTNHNMASTNLTHRNSMTGMSILGSHAPGSDQMNNNSSAPYQPGLNAYTMRSNSGSAQMPTNYTYSQAPQLNGSIFNHTSNQHPQQMSFLGHRSSRFDNSQANNHHQMQNNGDHTGVDWTGMFTQGDQDGFLNSQTGDASSQSPALIKTEPDTKPDLSSIQTDFGADPFLSSLYSYAGGYGSDDHTVIVPGLPSWSTDDPFAAKVDALVRHCFPQGNTSSLGDPAAELVHSILQIDNIKHFVEHYTSYHLHWPIIHMPTFKLSEANNNLILAMICIGAVYSPRLNVHQVRKMMDFVKSTVYDSSTVLIRTMNGQTQGLGTQPFELEEFQALTMLHILFTWHGDPTQRSMAHADFPRLVVVAKMMGLCDTAPPGHPSYSMLHDPRGSLPCHLELSNWDWRAWLEQETRNRAIYPLMLIDAAMVIYFNSMPQFDPLEMRLMLPADDAAWESSSAQECANALGLSGPQAQAKNINGSHKSIQPSMRSALRTLLDPYATFPDCATNLYSKFLMVHAIMTRIITCQRAALQSDEITSDFGLLIGTSTSSTSSSSTPATPLSQNEWLEHKGSGNRHLSGNDSSGQVTPTESCSPFGQQQRQRPQPQPQQQQSQPQQEQQQQQEQETAIQLEKKRLGQALEKWKRNWDRDLEVQYPPSLYEQRRFGFIRDGVHFFYLGRSFLQSQHATEFALPADVRFKRVFELLKRIKSIVNDDSETKGQELGSVGEIDETYGLDNLTLDMKLLFKPFKS